MDKPLELPEFDQLVKLAQEDPQALENLRQTLCQNLIAQAPESYQHRLRGLQFKIDMERRKAKTPMAACIKLSSMMQDSFHQLRSALNEVTGQKAVAVGGSPMATQSSTSPAPTMGRIIRFPQR